ncbi:MAG: Uma2 family endonuclease, partial [Nostoc sp.]
SPDENGRFWIEALGLFLGVWMGRKAELESYWLRWWDKSGNLLFWGSELLEQERQRAKQERQRAEQAEQKAARLAQRLREMGINHE